jgi:riboflavin kinase/FMN adenylyltransferase
MGENIFGTVVSGLGKGREFGFPTVNIKLNNSELYIEKGVYVVIVTIENQLYEGMLYVGTRPTLALQDITIEIHILNFNKEIYNEQISFQILQKIRDEIHFSSIEKLVKQLHQDKEMVNKYFKYVNRN